MALGLVISYIGLLILGPTITVGRSHSTQQRAAEGPTCRYAVEPGDIVLAGITSVHGWVRGHSCGQLSRRWGVRTVEAMLYTLDNINRSLYMLPSIKLGAWIVDECAMLSRSLPVGEFIDSITGSCRNGLITRLVDVSDMQLVLVKSQD